jgi:polyhydroxyalkanoate synthase
MPAAMHSFYLRNMYHENQLKGPEGIILAKVLIDLREIKFPTYFLSTRARIILLLGESTYARTQLMKGPIRFVLDGSGHVAGVVNPPAATKHGYWTNERKRRRLGCWSYQAR